MSRGTEHQFVSTDAGAILSSLTAQYETMTGRTLQPADPDQLFIRWVTGVIVQERVNQNYTGNQNIPSRAEGVNLDAIGGLFYDTTRPAATAATCTVRVTISAAQETAILIPAGTRFTDTSGTLVWDTLADTYIAIGDTYADVAVQCETTGAAGNGYVAGQINTLVDISNVLYYASCANTATSTGGADAATDDEYYNLMRASEDAYSVAGPNGAYEYWARQVDSTNIADVKAIRPIETVSKTLSLYTLSGALYAFLGGDTLDTGTLAVFPHGSSTAATLDTDYTIDYTNGLLTISVLSGGALASETEIDVTIDADMAGHVYVYVLMADGTIAGSATKAAVLAACNDDEVRPLTDYVSVEDPGTVSYDIDLTYYIQSDTSVSASDIQTAVTAAVAEYTAWQRGKLGRDINPSALYRLLMAVDGIKRVEIASPAFTVLSDGSNHSAPQVAAVGITTVTNGGYEDE